MDREHFEHVVREGLMKARISIDIATADFKALLVPTGGRSRRAPSIVSILRKLAEKGVEIRVLHGGTPSKAATHELDRKRPARFALRRCPRLHAKAVVVDCRAMYLGSANLTGAGLGAKAEGKRNFEWGVWTESSALIEAVLDQFNALWEGRRCEKCRRLDVCPATIRDQAKNCTTDHTDEHG